MNKFLPFLFSTTAMPILREGEGLGGGAPAPAPAAPSEVTAPWGTEGVWTVGEGEAAKPWHSLLSDEAARSHVEAKGYANPNELALANFNLTKMQRGDPTVVGVPGANATDDDWNAFYGKLGRPDAPEGYELNFAEGTETDATLVDWSKKAFHEVGLTPRQAQALAEKWTAFTGEQNANVTGAVATQNDTEIAALETKWGADLQRNKAAGQRVVQALGLSPEHLDRVEAAIGAAPLIEMLAMIGRKTDEGGFKSGGTGGDPNNPDTMSREQATAKINQLMGDPEFQKKYTDKAHPGNAEAIRLMERLYSKA